LATAMRNSIPEDELFSREFEPERASWSSVESLLALLIDEVRNLTWVQVQSRSDSKVPRPEPVRRPGASRRKPARVLNLDIVRTLDPRLRDVPDEDVQDVLDRMTGRGNG